ncbi:hypothetical protein M8C21_017055, partial [Ambrosia artemisiifolia]
MVTLVVSTTTDPASFGPATALLTMGTWAQGASFQGIRSKVNGDVRLLEHDQGIVEEDCLDDRWEEATGEVVDEIIFLSKHTAVTNRPALTVHPIGIVFICLVMIFECVGLFMVCFMILCVLLGFRVYVISLGSAV